MTKKVRCAPGTSPINGLSERASARLRALIEVLNPLAAAIAHGSGRNQAAGGPASGPAEPSICQRSRRPRGDVRVPRPGSQLRRIYRGREYIVNVVDGGFECDGERYRSLSALAKRITGAHWNGLLFFGLVTQVK